VAKTGVAKIGSLKDRLNEIDMAVMGEIYEPFTASRQRILVGMWEKGEAIGGHFRGVKCPPSYRELERQTGRKHISLKKWHDLYEKYPDKEEYIEKYARPRAEAWAGKALGLGSPPPALPIPPLPVGVYDVILADPPWKFSNSGFTSSPNQHYPVMETQNICNMPIGERAAENSVLFLWAVNAMLEDALQVLKAWGFEYKTNIAWVKERPMGLGFYCLGKHELLLIATKGSKVPVGEIPHSAIIAANTAHSVKPECFYEIIEKMYPESSYLELFARSERERWESFGNQLNAPA
jgi:N6-adenosine-specific RNA methylase IME4